MMQINQSSDFMASQQCPNKGLQFHTTENYRKRVYGLTSMPPFSKSLFLHILRIITACAISVSRQHTEDQTIISM